MTVQWRVVACDGGIELFDMELVAANESTSESDRDWNWSARIETVHQPVPRGVRTVSALRLYGPRGFVCEEVLHFPFSVLGGRDTFVVTWNKAQQAILSGRGVEVTL